MQDKIKLDLPNVNVEVLAEELAAAKPIGFKQFTKLTKKLKLQNKVYKEDLSASEFTSNTSQSLSDWLNPH